MNTTLQDCLVSTTVNKFQRALSSIFINDMSRLSIWLKTFLTRLEIMVLETRVDIYFPSRPYLAALLLASLHIPHPQTPEYDCIHSPWLARAPRAWPCRPGFRKIGGPAFRKLHRIQSLPLTVRRTSLPNGLSYSVQSSNLLDQNNQDHLLQASNLLDLQTWRTYMEEPFENL